MKKTVPQINNDEINGPVDGTVRTLDNKSCVFYEGYWIRRYDISQGTYGSYADKKRLISMLTRRVFHNTEAGINIPGHKLDETRAAYENDQNPAQKRIHAAMLAGALLNRATDILTHVVELQKDGVEITPQNELIRTCGKNLMEALELGKQVKHFSGMEGIDELWGEPFKAFSLPVDKFYKSRYLKIGQSMAMIDHISVVMKQELGQINGFEKLDSRINKFAGAAKLVVETIKADPAFLLLWPEFVTAGEELLSFKHTLADDLSPLQRLGVERTLALIKSGRNLISYVSSARVPMPKSSNQYIEKCQSHVKDMRNAFSD